MARLDALLQWYATLTPATLRAIGRHYRPDAHFKDPFNDVRGLDAIEAVFAHMFATTEAPRFVIRDVARSADRAFVSWDFAFGLRGANYAIHGVTCFVFDDQGLVAQHRDYWDAAEELWQKLPLLGGPVRWLRRRFRAPGPARP